MRKEHKKFKVLIFNVDLVFLLFALSLGDDGCCLSYCHAMTIIDFRFMKIKKYEVVFNIKIMALSVRREAVLDILEVSV